VQFQNGYCALACQNGKLTNAVACQSPVETGAFVCFLRAGRETNELQRKIECCMQYPTSKSFNCESVLSMCEEAKKGETVLDAFGEPITGKYETTLTEACNNAGKAVTSDGTSSSSKGNGLSGGAIAGIVIACVVVVGAVAGAVVYTRVVGNNADNEADGKADV
jgi:hypothetical protein